MEKRGTAPIIKARPESLYRVSITAILLCIFSVISLSLSSDDRDRAHQVYFESTDHELHVYRIFGCEPGKTVLIIGGIHGNEPGGYLAADKYVDLTLRKGNLIIVPRANLKAILARNRGISGDYNRKFNTELDDNDSDDQVVKVLKQLIEESDVLLNLHDGTGFFRESYIDKLHNPYRFGQSVIADCDLYYTDQSEQAINLGEIARRVVEKTNSNIDEEEYHFHFSNHDSISPNTRYPEMRKTATYFALTENNIPAFGIETSKELPTTEMKVTHQVLAINAFLEEFGVVPDVPDRSVDPPRMDYVVVSVNSNEARVVNDGDTLNVKSGDRVKISHIVGNYERHMYADFVGLGGHNDNSREVTVTRPIKVSIRKDGDICGGFKINPYSEVERTVTVTGIPSSANFILEVNGSRVILPVGSELKVVRGDRLKILDYLAPDVPNGINVNFLGFVGNPQDNRGEDRGYLIDTSSTLLPDWSLDGQGDVYAIAVKLGKREITRMTVRLIEPTLDYMVVRRNGDRPIVLQAGETWRLNDGDKLTILGSHSSAPAPGDLYYRLVDSSGLQIPLDSNSFQVDSDAIGNSANLAVMRGDITLGTIRLSINSAVRLDSDARERR